MDWAWENTSLITPPSSSSDVEQNLSTLPGYFYGVGGGGWQSYAQAKFAELLELMQQLEYQNQPYSPVSKVSTSSFPNSPTSEIPQTPLRDCPHQQVIEPVETKSPPELKICPRTCTQCHDDRKERRRAQNRAAQRKFRERKETALELLVSTIDAKDEEIASLRKANEALSKHLKLLQQEIAQLAAEAGVAKEAAHSGTESHTDGPRAET